MRRICWVLYLLTLFSTGVFAQNFNREKVLKKVEILSHDSLEGRKTGTTGNAIARNLIEDYYKKYDLKFLKTNNGYLHPFQIKSVKGINVLGYIPGTQNPERYLFISAHYDHLGKIEGKIYNGADDNASGVGGLLAAIEYFSRNPPENSLVFAAFDAEEIELLGSEAFVENPLIPLNQILLNINLDMISRNDKNEIYVCGTRYYPYLKAILQKAQKKVPNIILKLGHDFPDPVHPSNDWTYSSDHAAFHKRDIPFLYFGVEDHVDYHKPTDTYGKINPDFYISAIQLIIRTIEKVDNHASLILKEKLKEGSIKAK